MYMSLEGVYLFGARARRYYVAVFPLSFAREHRSCTIHPRMDLEERPTRNGQWVAQARWRSDDDQGTPERRQGYIKGNSFGVRNIQFTKRHALTFFQIQLPQNARHPPECCRLARRKQLAHTEPIRGLFHL